MARRESFNTGSRKANARNSCVRCGEGFNRKIGTQRVGGSLFTAEGEMVYAKREAIQTERGEHSDFPRGKYCPGCESEHEAEGGRQADRSGDYK